MAPEQYRAQAQSLANNGDFAGALRVMDKGLQDHPDLAPLANSAGNFAMKAGKLRSAAAYFEKALACDPGRMEYAINAAIAHAGAGRHEQALQTLAPFEHEGARDARYCSVRGGSARGRGDLAQAARWFDLALALDPRRAKAAHGRARVALERGEADLLPRFEHALSLNQSDPEAWLGYAEALEAAGDVDRALDVAQQLVGQAPHWIAALRLLAQMRLAAGEADFTSHFAEAERRLPADKAVTRAQLQVLEQHDLIDRAMEVAQGAARRFPEDPVFVMLVASYAGMQGDRECAKAGFDTLDLDTPDRWLLEARFLMQVQDYARVGHLLDKVIAADPAHISAWAVRDLLWRATGDERAHWLHGQKGLVRMVELPDGESVLADAVPLLHALHDASAFPLGQSLRGGTQTRGNLFDRAEPEIAALRQSIAGALEIYRQGLPATDEAHPLLRHRDSPWTLAGSWSVRLDAKGDYHASHIHPQGIVSSALYCELPDDLGDGPGKDGWIELGRPPPEMRVDLEPLHALKPQKGHLALFPSTLYHGTRPFDAGRRMTIAFDVVLDSSL